jgi:hypothetical protein
LILNGGEVAIAAGVPASREKNLDLRQCLGVF